MKILKCTVVVFVVIIISFSLTAQESADLSARIATASLGWRKPDQYPLHRIGLSGLDCK